MKKTLIKITKALLIASMTLAIIIVGIATAPHIVHAATSTATLTNAKMSFDGGTVREIQTYNVNGYNFVRARDITDILDMRVVASGNENFLPGVLIIPNSKSDSVTTMERITQQTAKVNIVKGEIVYAGKGTEVEMFALNDRYYFKLAICKPRVTILLLVRMSSTPLWQMEVWQKKLQRNYEA